MSLFISVENQNLLYEIIHKTNDIHIVFPKGSPSTEKNEWFRNFIETTYRQLPTIITREQLKTINRKVLSTMINSLQNIVNKKKGELHSISNNVIHDENIAAVYSSSNMQNSVIPFHIEAAQSISLNSASEDGRFNDKWHKKEHSSVYESKELQYRSLFEIQKPKPIDFSEKIDDEIITNMSELIEQQKKMRERELQEYAPVSPTIHINPSENIKVNILEEISKDELQSTVINDKRVSFSIPLDNNNNNTIENNKMSNNNIVSISDSVNDYNDLKNKIQIIDNKLNTIFDLIQKLVPSNEINNNNNISNTHDI